MEPNIDKGPAVDLSGKQVNFMISWTHLGAAEALAKWFNNQTGAIVRIMKVEYHDLLSSTLADFTSNTPQVDVIMLWYAHLGRLVQEGVLQNLDDFYQNNQKQIQVSDYITHFCDSYTLFNGHRWALPFDGDKHVLFYRKSVFKKYSLTPPKTWDDYARISRLITEKESQNGLYGSAIMAHPTPILIISSFMNRLGGFGGRLSDKDQNPTVNSPQAIMALETLVEQSMHALPTPLETDFAVSRDAFLQGQVAMVEHWTDIGIMAQDSQQSQIKNDWSVVPLPVKDADESRKISSLNAGWSLGISSKAENPDTAKAFLAFVARPDITLKLNMIPGGGGIDPVRKSVVVSKEFQKFAPQISRVEELLLDGEVITWPNQPAVPELLESLSRAIVASLEGRMTPQKALDECQKEWILLTTEK